MFISPDLVSLKESQVVIYRFWSLSVAYIADIVEPVELPHNAALYLGIRCLPKYLFVGF